MLTKSNFMGFVRCSCELWLLKQRPDLAPPTDPALQRILDEGNVVDAYAQKLFPGAVSVDGFGKPAAKRTMDAIASGASILLQPTFMTDDHSCRADILVRRGDVWDIYEVKSSTQVKDEHVMDVAFQKMCIEEAGIAIGDTYLVHINNQYVRQGDVDPKGLFSIVKITDDVLAVTPKIRELLPDAHAILSWPKEPGLQHLAACRDPYACSFLPCYMDAIPGDTLYAIANGLPPERVRAFLERGLLTPEQVPPELLASFDDLKLPGATHEPVIHIDKEALTSEFATLEYPIYFLDYETFFPAIPRFDGYRPYSHMTFQYSVHIQHEPNGPLEHREFLAEHDADPAPALAAALREHIGDTGSVIVWNAQFEASRNTEMGEKLPRYTDFFRSLNDRMFDLMLMVRKGYYVDSRFGGSASIKKVLPVLCPELTYKNLVIQEGGTASSSWATLIDPKTPATVRNELRTNMLAYCERDTMAMVALLEKFTAAASNDEVFESLVA